ncbi:putative secreted protein [Enterococcus sp. C1]|uniref:hypothetical protein n=1 Tax=Enterococcus sp. C1 TaxID=1182762 RepID=UPI000272192D|nr:hypothetical protein [Enterococcus sp. C1]EJF48108.1 putative secreted protein [Enterococcus sp. C1]
MEIIESTFPGIKKELIENGAVDLNLGNQIDWFQYGSWKVQIISSTSLLFNSRSLLDSLIRQRILKNKKIIVLSEYKVKGIICDKQKNKISRVVVKKGAHEEIIEGDIIIDASGFSSKMPEWLECNGYTKPEKDQVKKEVGYASRVYDAKPDEEIRTTLIWSSSDNMQRIGIVLPMENNQFMFSLGGAFSDQPKSDEDEFMKFAENLDSNRIYELLLNREAAGKTRVFKFHGSTWTRYDKLKYHPSNLIVAGAALCYINPFFGQGISICSEHADIIGENILDWQLGVTTIKDINKKLKKATAQPWNMSKIEDYRHLHVDGHRSMITRFLLWYTKKYLIATNSDAYLRNHQIELYTMQIPSYQLFNPRVILKTFKKRGKGKHR